MQDQTNQQELQANIFYRSKLVILQCGENEIYRCLVIIQIKPPWQKFRCMQRTIFHKFSFEYYYRRGGVKKENQRVEDVE